MLVIELTVALAFSGFIAPWLLVMVSTRKGGRGRYPKIPRVVVPAAPTEQVQDVNNGFDQEEDEDNDDGVASLHPSDGNESDGVSVIDVNNELDGALLDPLIPSVSERVSVAATSSSGIIPGTPASVGSVTAHDGCFVERGKLQSKITNIFLILYYFFFLYCQSQVRHCWFNGDGGPSACRSGPKSDCCREDPGRERHGSFSPERHSA